MEEACSLLSFGVGASIRIATRQLALCSDCRCKSGMNLPSVCGMPCLSQILSAAVETELQVVCHELCLEHLQSFHLL